MTKPAVDIPTEAWDAALAHVEWVLHSPDGMTSGTYGATIRAIEAAARYIARAAVVAELHRMAERLRSEPFHLVDPYLIAKEIADELRSRADELETEQ